MEKKVPAAVVFKSINVNAIDSQSGIFIGENTQWNWYSSSKSNSGFGTVKGQNNRFYGSRNIVIDPDTIDNPTNFTSEKPKKQPTHNRAAASRS